MTGSVEKCMPPSFVKSAAVNSTVNSAVNSAVNSVVPALTVCAIVDSEMHVTLSNFTPNLQTRLNFSWTD